MPYDEKDPRSALMAKAAGSKAADEYAATEYGRFYDMDPVETTDSAKIWYFRGQNYVVSYIEAKAGAEFAREDQPDEYVLLAPDPEISMEITAMGETKKVGGFTLSILPPGKNSIRLTTDGRLVILYTVKSEDLAAKCANAASFETPHANVALLEPWPEPTDGYRLRTYSLDVPKEEGRFGRIFRCTTFMVNYLDLQVGPRDSTKMSPHSHDDFEQCSLALGGEFEHHIRYPWGINMNNWRDDEHELCKTPSVAIIPPPSIHTTRGCGAGENQLVDIFCPPRMDFSQKPGWVLNADEYPMPE